MTAVGLWERQVEGAERAARDIARYGGHGLWWSMRCGKTGAAIGTLDLIGARRTLVVAPRAVVEDDHVWRTAARRHLGEVPVLELTRGTTKDKAEDLSRFGDGIVTVTWDSVWREPLASMVRKHGWDLVIADEIHMMKSPSSKRAKFMIPLARTVPARLGLSGTPMGQQPMDLWSVYEFLCPGIFGGFPVEGDVQCHHDFR